MMQADLFEEVLRCYQSADGALSNEELYQSLHRNMQLNPEVTERKVSLESGDYNAFKRKVRWYQQTLKHAGILEKVPGERAQWMMPKRKDSELDKVLPSVSLLGFSTKLGLAIVGYSESVFAKFDEPIHLILTSPPYPLANPRKYGNVTEAEYVDWICKTIEPAVKNLVDGGSICLNISNDIFMPGMPSRSLYRERLVLALYDRLGLHKMDELIWENKSKPPGPYQWASKNRFQLNVSWEPVYWFTNNPHKVFSDNRRVLEPHSPEHMKLMLSGGVKSSANKSDGAYRVKEGSYGNITAGKIPKNIISVGSACAKNRAYKAYAESIGLTPHGAMMPFKLASFLINFLTERGQVVADLFSGSFTVPQAAELNGRRWVGCEPVLDYVIGGAFRFQDADGFVMSLNGGYHA